MSGQTNQRTIKEGGQILVKKKYPLVSRTKCDRNKPICSAEKMGFQYDRIGINKGT